MNTKNNSSTGIIVLCPTCKNEVVWDAHKTTRPFCSERCKLIDLGEWAAEENKIAGDPVHPDLNNDPYF